MLRFVENGVSFVRYNGKCYDFLSDIQLNHLCQIILGDDRELFNRSSLRDLNHYGIGGEFYDAEKTIKDQASYLPLSNGLYDLKRRTLIDHTPDIFTTNLLPYDYDPEATCPRWIQFLNEVSLGDQEMIKCLQEASGYIFHLAIPKPALFFLVGIGANGKSAFLNILIELVGKINSCSVNLNLLSKEYYIRELQNKMINISTETPRNRQTSMDQIKAICAGDMVTGRSIYDRPVKFKPYAKHFLAMNELPIIDDKTFGMQRRLYIFNFNRTLTEQEMDVNLHEKLCVELPGIFNWALEGLCRLKENAFIFSFSQRMTQMKEEYRSSCSKTCEFIEKYFVNSGTDSRIIFKDVYTLYKSYCSEMDFIPESKKGFKIILESKGHEVRNSTLDHNAVCVFGAEMKQ
jgi:putative DNA primase/helicase